MMCRDTARAAEFGDRIHASITSHPLFAHHFFELRHLIGMEGFVV
jgi:hypothetical protein